MRCVRRTGDITWCDGRVFIGEPLAGEVTGRGQARHARPYRGLGRLRQQNNVRILSGMLPVYSVRDLPGSYPPLAPHPQPLPIKGRRAQWRFGRALNALGWPRLSPSKELPSPKRGEGQGWGAQRLSVKIGRAHV